MSRIGTLVGIAGSLAACTSSTIDAGTNDAGRGDVAAPADAAMEAGPEVIARSIQLTPTKLVSDGTSLFWASDLAGEPGSPIWSMSDLGGAASIVVPGSGPIANADFSDFLVVDDASVYYSGADGIYRAPKSGGGSPELVNEASDAGNPLGPVNTTVFGGDLYWLAGGDGESSVVNRAPLRGGPTSVVAELPSSPAYGSIAVDASRVFLAADDGIDWFPLDSGVLDGGGLARIPGFTDRCLWMVPDPDAVFCLVGPVGSSPSIVRVTMDGASTVLGTIFAAGFVASSNTLDTASGVVAFDDEFVYWVDALPVGAIMRVPKTGGAPRAIASASSPFAVAVDSNAIYWSDEGGEILRLAK